MRNSSKDFILLDGSVGEAGGQILRVALTLSPISGANFRITKIRANRSKSGLLPQHLMGVKAAAEVCGARVDGAEIGSQELSFEPSVIKGGRYVFDIGTAGSVTLLAQSLIPILLCADKPSTLVLKGGTHVEWSPTADYYEHLLIPLIHKMGAEVSMKVNSYGWYPKGGGEVEIIIKPSRLSSIELTNRGELKGVYGVCSASNLKEEVLAREEQGIREILPNIELVHNNKPSMSTGTAITLWAEYEHTVIGADARGKIGRRAEIVGKEAAEALKKEMDSTGVVDKHMSDQLLIYMALAHGRSKMKVAEITTHSRTCSEIIPKFTKVPFEINNSTISVEGIS